MGSYLSEPITKKESADESNDKLTCGASSMQGWRVSQEDAHNCILDFDTKTSLFAVYDGHGGHEVALYCSKKLPDFIKQTKAYKENDIEKSLIDGFLSFDATIATREVVAELTDIAGLKSNGEEDSDEEENVDNLYEEAAMPIEQVIEKYTSDLINPAIKNLKDVGKLPKSPYLTAKKDKEVAGGSSSASSSCEASNKSETKPTENSEEETHELKTEEKANPESNGDIKVPDVIVTSPSVYDTKESKEDVKQDSEDSKDDAIVNGEVSEPEAKDEDDSNSSPQENGDIGTKGKGKAILKKGARKTAKRSTRPKRNAQQLYKQLLDFGEDNEEESEDDDDKTFEGPGDESSDDDEEGVNTSIEAENSEESSGEEEEVEEEEEDEDDMLDDDEDEKQMKFAREMKEEPGSDSGCTAVVALLRENELYVANAGDSRCVVCRNGKAIEMSIDHKPEDKPERDRVEKAGGEVFLDGRINGGLNLSRAIGDHAYKQNKELSDREQMITALPDVKQLKINPGEDEFMVMACDGIWNFMSSEEVVDFVRERIDEHSDKLSEICEEMFDHCLAPDTHGDGTGCDNMTAIIVRFKQNILKRSASPTPIELDTKRAKTDESESQAETAA